MTYSLELDFIAPAEGDLPHPSVSQIYVKTHTSNEEGSIFITPDCVSIRELEGQVDRLKNELNEILKKAKRKYSEQAKK